MGRNEMGRRLAQHAFLPSRNLLLCLLLASPAQADFSGRVTGVREGDLLDIRHGGRIVRIRLAGIDAPEPDQRFGRDTRQQLAAMAGNRQAQVLERGMDKHGYTVARVVVNGVDLGLAQIEAGMAWHFDPTPPLLSPQTTQQYRQAEAKARKTRLGLWRDLNPLPPWDWSGLRQRPGRGR